jgi:hypothetical protein
MRRLAVVALGLAMTASACGGPQRPFELGVKEIPSDLLLGRQTKPPLPLPAQLPPMTFFFSDVAGPTPPPPELPPPLPEPTPVPDPCPEANPLDPVRLETQIDAPRPPTPATYAYRTSGTVIGNSLRTLGPTSTHDVANIVPLAPGEFTFDVGVQEGDRRTVTTYHVVPRTSLVVPPGLYIARVDSGDIVPFQPKPELMLLPFPALPGAAYNAAGTDGLTTVRYDGRVVDTERIDACGTNIDAIHVEITNGVATTGRAQDGEQRTETFSASYAVATQYGGLPVREHLVGDVAGLRLSRAIDAVITSEPKDPGP